MAPPPPLAQARPPSKGAPSASEKPTIRACSHPRAQTLPLSPAPRGLPITQKSWLVSEASECEGEVHETPQAGPQCLDARLTVTLASQEAAEPGHRAHRLA